MNIIILFIHLKQYLDNVDEIYMHAAFFFFAKPPYNQNIV